VYARQPPRASRHFRDLLARIFLAKDLLKIKAFLRCRSITYFSTPFLQTPHSSFKMAAMTSTFLGSAVAFKATAKVSTKKAAVSPVASIDGLKKASSGLIVSSREIALTSSCGRPNALPCVVARWHTAPRVDVWHAHGVVTGRAASRHAWLARPSSDPPFPGFSNVACVDEGPRFYPLRSRIGSQVLPSPNTRFLSSPDLSRPR